MVETLNETRTVGTKSIYDIGSYGHHRFTLSVTETKVDLINNQSSISWTFKMTPEKTGYKWEYNSAPVTWTLYVNGSKWTGGIKSYDGTSTLNLKSGSATIPHNYDGTKSINFSFDVKSQSVSYLTGNASSNGSLTLTKIARLATITYAPHFTDESSPILHYEVPLPEVAERVRTCISFTPTSTDIAYRDVDKNGTSYTYKFTKAEKELFQKHCANQKSCDVYFWITTVIGGKNYHHSLKRTLTIANAELTINPTVEDTNPASLEQTGNKSKVIRYVSNLKFSMNPNVKKFATLKSTTITCGGKTFNGTTGEIKQASSGQVEFNAVDTRGYTATIFYTQEVINYSKVTCSMNIDAPNGEGKSAIHLNGDFFNGNFGKMDNRLTLMYRFKENDGTYGNWITIKTAPTLSNGRYTVNHPLTGLNYLNKYTFQAKAVDVFYEALSAERVTKTTPIFDWSENDVRFNVPVNANAGININGITYGKQQVIADVGGKYMHGTQDEQLSMPISKTQNGIVLVFSDRSNGAVHDWGFNCFFVPKESVKKIDGKGYEFNMFRNNFSAACSKYLYIYDTHIKGYEQNDKSGTGATGIKFNNSAYVLRWVIAV